MQSSATSSTTQPASAEASASRRRLILIRHSKAVEEDIGGDHTRALSERGLADASALAAWLKQQGIKPDLALCSTATRTRQTLAALGPNIPTILSDKIYLASARDMLAQIQATDDAVQTLMLIGHNPGLHSLLGILVGECEHEDDADRMLLKFPTSACAVVDFNAASWKEIALQSGRLVTLRA